MNELSEANAVGEISSIFEEVRDLWCTPYVSAVHRVMAARPGLLEWAWEAVAPPFRAGEPQAAAWALIEDLELPALDPLSSQALAAWRIDEAQRPVIRAITASFTRVAPVNMMFAALIRRVLEENMACAARAAPDPWPRPEAIGHLPGMVDTDASPAHVRACLAAFASEMHGQPFVPGLYRMLAHWPGLLAHLATVLPGMLQSDVVQSAYDAIRARVDEAADRLELSVPTGTLSHARPGEPIISDFRSLAETYRRTSPEMIVAGGIIRQALPLD